MGNNTYPISYAAINKNEMLRNESSSGGVFYLLAREILNKGGVVFGARCNENNEVEHSYCEDIQELSSFLGSKYVQSKMGRTYCKVQEFLKEGRTVLFSGTPCQIHGLKNYLGKDYANLYTTDFVCHGVPSPLIWRTYLKENFGQEQITKVSFRDKTEGWKDFSLKLCFEDEDFYQKNRRKDPYILGFLQNLYLRPSCYECHFKGIVRKSDLTMADFWKIEDIHPEMDDDKGTSLILIQSSKGEELWNAVKGELTWIPVDIEESIKGNSAATHSVPLTEKRAHFYQAIRQGSKVDETVVKLTKRTILQKVKNRLKLLIK